MVMGDRKTSPIFRAAGARPACVTDGRWTTAAPALCVVFSLCATAVNSARTSQGTSGLDALAVTEQAELGSDRDNGCFEAPALRFTRAAFAKLSDDHGRNTGDVSDVSSASEKSTRRKNASRKSHPVKATNKKHPTRRSHAGKPTRKK